MTKRELLGLFMVLAAFALTPFAYGASVAFGLLAFVIGIVGVLLFVTARPWRSRVTDSDYSGPRKVPFGVPMHDLGRPFAESLHGSDHAGAPDGGTGGNGGGGSGDGGGTT